MSKANLVSFLIVVSLVLGGCAPPTANNSSSGLLPTATTNPVPSPTPLPTRPVYDPAQLVDYTAQTGDTLPAVAAHFNTSVEEILKANPVIPKGATTLPPGLPMQVPIYYRPFWGSSYQIIPDSQYVNGPAAIDFDTQAFVDGYPGWLARYVEYVGGKNRTGAGVIDYVAQNFSISPRLLVALVEYRVGGLNKAILSPEQADYTLGYRSSKHKGLYLQLVWAANLLNNGYYGWRTGDLVEFDRSDGTTERPDPWQNAATVALQILFNEMYGIDKYIEASGPIGLAKTYRLLFGDPWKDDTPHIPGSLTQPAFLLPFEAGRTWSYTGGPHTGWGTGAPYAALDFAPPSETPGCFSTQLWATAVAPGLVIRSETGIAVLDLDMDGDERTGWVIFYLHLGTYQRATVGTVLEAGDPVGHPSCEGGTSTGSHVHVARKYNGEWITADSALPFVMEGWIPHRGVVTYLGTLVRFEKTITACVCGDAGSHILATGNPDGSQASNP